MLVVFWLGLGAAAALGQTDAQGPDAGAALDANAAEMDAAAPDATEQAGNDADTVPDADAAETAEPPVTGWLVGPWRVWHYFGVWGVGSILLWAVVLACGVRFALVHPAGRVFAVAAVLSLFVLLMCVNVQHGSTFAMWGLGLLLTACAILLLGRAVLQWPVVVLVLLALWFADVNSEKVTAIEVDRRAQIAEMARRRAEAEQRAERERRLTAATERFATAEMSAEDKRALAEAAGEEGETYDVSRYVDSGDAAGSDEPEYAYRQRGKQQRDPAARADGDGDAAEEGSGDEDADEPRLLPDADVARANRWDRWNLAVVRWLPWVALWMVLSDYLHRFNRTRPTRAPLPIAHRWIDALFPKSRTVRFAGDRASLRDCLRNAVRKGETFIHLGPTDPWPGRAALARLDPAGLDTQADGMDGEERVQGSREGIAAWTFRPLPKQTIPASEVARRAEFIFESVWFGRLCVVIPTGDDPRAGGEALAALVRHLRVRHVPRAAARRTVYLAWDTGHAPDADQLRDLTWLCRTANFKLLLRIPEGTDLPDDAGVAFDEVITDPA